MNVVLTLVFLGVLLFVVGRLQIRPRRISPDDPAWNRFDEVPSAETFGYVAMFLAGVFLAAAVAGVAAVGLADPDDPPLGPLVVFAGAVGIWCWFYDGFSRRLRRVEPTPGWTRMVSAVGEQGKRLGPVAVAVGVVLTIVL